MTHPQTHTSDTYPCTHPWTTARPWTGMSSIGSNLDQRLLSTCRRSVSVETIRGCRLGRYVSHDTSSHTSSLSSETIRGCSLGRFLSHDTFSTRHYLYTFLEAFPSFMLYHFTLDKFSISIHPLTPLPLVVTHSHTISPSSWYTLSHLLPLFLYTFDSLWTPLPPILDTPLSPSSTISPLRDTPWTAFEGCKLDESNQELKDMMRKCVRLGQEEYQQKLDAAGDYSLLHLSHHTTLSSPLFSSYHTSLSSSLFSSYKHPL